MAEQYKPIVELVRGDVSEIVVYGAHAVMLESEDSFLGANFPFATRSLLNPWQFIASGYFGDQYFYAIGLALHSGQDVHMQALKELSQIHGITEQELICPRDYPIDFFEMAKLKVSGSQPSRYHNPNSGKHVLSIASCRAREWSIEDYWKINHPLQKSLLNLIGKEAGEKVSWLSDSCGMPTAVMSVRALLRMWSKFASEETPIAESIKKLWIEYPEVVGGHGRLETELNHVTQGKAIVKEGADGLLLVQSLPVSGQKAAGLWVKLASGYHRTHLAASLVAAIESYQGLPQVFHLLHSHLKGRLDDWLRPGIKVKFADL